MGLVPAYTEQKKMTSGSKLSSNKRTDQTAPSPLNKSFEETSLSDLLAATLTVLGDCQPWSLAATYCMLGSGY